VVPGVNGNVIGYEALARELGPDQPLYGLRSVGLDGESAPLDDIREIAASLLTEVERVQPHGPYRLAGFCMGGIVAYEMAQQLAARGEQTALLGLVDTWAPELIQTKSRRTRQVAQLAFLAQGALRRLREMWKQPRGQRLSYLLRSGRILGEMVKQRDVYRGESHVLHREMVTRANQRAAAGYRPTGYDGEVLLVLSNEVPRAPEQDARLSWQKLARGGSTVVRVTGKDSGELLKAPHVANLAAALDHQLAASGGDADRS
jgi:thioesterase domain-containing protein